MKLLKFLLISILFIGGCVSPNVKDFPYSYVLLKKGKNYNVEIELKYEHLLPGGACEPDSKNVMDKLKIDCTLVYRTVRSLWIYTNSTKGNILYTNFVLSGKKDGVPYKNIRGHMKLLEKTLQINILEPQYDEKMEKPSHWVNSRFNGVYEIKKNAGKEILGGSV